MLAKPQSANASVLWRNGLTGIGEVVRGSLQEPVKEVVCG
jgi:hypothetical protein